MKIFDVTKVFLKDNGGIILTTVACIGVAVTAVLAARAQMKVDDILEESKVDDLVSPENIEKEKRETRKKILKKYAPVIMSGTVTIGCIAGACVFHEKKIDKYVKLFVGSEFLSASYRQFIREKYGEDADKEAYQYASSSVTAHTGGKGGLNYPITLLTFVEPVTGFEFQADERDFLRACIDINWLNAVNEDASLHMFLEYMGLENIPENAEEYGWDMEYLCENNGEAFIHINFETGSDGKKYIVYNDMFGQHDCTPSIAQRVNTRLCRP